MFERRKEMNREIYEQFKERYEIVVEDVKTDSGILSEAGTSRRAL